MGRPRRTQETRRRQRRAAIVVTAVLCGATALTACAPEVPGHTDPAFALTSAGVVVPAGQDYPLNFLFVASPNDPIWTDLNGISLPGGPSFAPGEFTLVEGESRGGLKIGNISAPIRPPEPIEFTELELFLSGEKDPLIVDVGDWRLEEGEEQAPLVDAEIVSMGSCERLEIGPSLDGVLESAELGTKGVDIVAQSVDESTGELSLALSCEDDFDLYVVTPTLTVREADGEVRRARQTPVAIGFQDLDDPDVERIAARR